jgi:hypothetical protein
MTKPPERRHVTVKITMSPEEQDIFLKFCFLRTFKTAIEQLELFLTGQIGDADKIDICLDDLNTIKDDVERVRSSITEAIRVEYARTDK